MTNEEREIITRFIERVSGRQAAGFAGSVPSSAPALPPIDPEADALIAELFARYPEARYRLTQMAFVQEHALAEAQNRIKRLEWEVEQLRNQVQALQAAQQGQAGQSQGRGFFSSLFGGGPAHPQPQPPPQPQYAPGAHYQPQSPPPPPPQYPPGYQPGMFQRSGSGFLGSALTTAAGVAGGMVLGNALMDLFSPHRAIGGGFGGGMAPGETIIENQIVEPGAGASPWGPAAGANANPWDVAENNPDLDIPTDDSVADPGAGWDDASNTDSGFDSSFDGDLDDTI
jgi:hypothetical protein